MSRRKSSREASRSAASSTPIRLRERLKAVAKGLSAIGAGAVDLGGEGPLRPGAVMFCGTGSKIGTADGTTSARLGFVT